MSGRALVLVIATGCGRLADGSYLGEPLYALTGNVYQDSSSSDLMGIDLRVALFWADEGSRSEEQAVVVTTRFPAEYTLELYQFPPDNARFEVPWDPDRRYAMGTPLVYADRNGDRVWNEPSEELVGGSVDQLVVFAEGPPDPVPSPDGVVSEIVEGFSRVYADLTTPLCAATENPLASAAATTPTDLSVGVEWWTRLSDLDCDGETDEWDGACPTGEELDRWCVDGADLGEVCSELCFDDPADEPDPNGVP